MWIPSLYYDIHLNEVDSISQHMRIKGKAPQSQKISQIC